MSRQAGFVTLAIAILSITAAAEESQVTPRAVLAVAPEYPAIAHQTGIAGTVTVRVTVEHSGAIGDASVIEGHRLLAESALAAARLWKFQTSGDSPRQVDLVFAYTLLPENACFQKTLSRFTPPSRVGVAVRKLVPTCLDCGPSKPIVYEKCE